MEDFRFDDKNVCSFKIDWSSCRSFEDIRDIFSTLNMTIDYNTTSEDYLKALPLIERGLMVKEETTKK